MRAGPVAAYLFGKGVKSIQGMVNTLDLNCNMGVDGAWKVCRLPIAATFLTVCRFWKALPSTTTCFSLQSPRVSKETARNASL
jgi:hypothetical protein